MASRLPSVPVISLAAAVFCSGTILIALGSDLVFLGDDWDIVVDRRANDADALLDPHVGHLVLAVVVIYKLLLGAFGMGSPVPFHVASTLSYLLAAVLLFAYMRRRVGEWLALLAVIPLLFFGAAAVDMLAPFQIFFSGSIAAGLGALLALDREDRLGDAAACALIVLSVCFSETGLAFAAGALVRIALSDRAWGPRLYVLLIPIALYALWWLGWGHTGSSSLSLRNLAEAPTYLLEAASYAVAALLGLASASDHAPAAVGQDWPPAVLAAALAGALALSLARLRRPGGLSPRLWAVLAIAIAFWAMAAANANVFREPGNGRYLYPSAVFVLLIAAELLAGMRFGRRTLAAVGAVAIASTAMNLVFLNDSYKYFWKPASERVKGGLTAIELVDKRDPAITASVVGAFVADVDAESYLSAVDAFGSPAYTEAELASASEDARSSADTLFAEAHRISLGPAAPARGPCRVVAASGTGAPGVRLGAGETVLRAMPGAQGEVVLGRFSDALPVELGPLPARGASVRIPADRSRRSWQLGLRGAGALRACGASVLGGGAG